MTKPKWIEVMNQPEDDDGTTPAPDGTRWVCRSCQRTSPTRYGFDKDNKVVADPGWRRQCVPHVVLCRPATEFLEDDDG